MSHLRRITQPVKAAVLALALLGLGQLQAQAPPGVPSEAAARAGAPEPARARFPVISEVDLKGWLTYLSSDELEGRQVFSEGYGMAAQFIAERLREWGVKPLGDHGSYFQIVKLQSYKVVRRSSVTIEANGQTRTFKDGDHVVFPAIGGGRQTLMFDRLELAGASTRLSATLQTGGAAATIEYRPVLSAAADIAQRGAGRGGAAGRGRLAQAAAADIPPTTARVDAVVPPRLTADDEFFSALLAAAPAGFGEVRERLARGESIPPATVTGVKVTIDVDNGYEPVTTQLTRNVVGMVPGSDPKLKDTYVWFGAHLDHVGYATSAQDVRGRVNTPIATDRIWNGADDDGTGSTGELGIAKAFATGPKPRRSVVFIWHAGEEGDLYGSKFSADFPVVPLEQVQCFLNIDMIGRNRNDDPAQANTVFVIGADRISTDLHNLIVRTNATLPAPLTLDYEYNDPLDPNSFYTRSDHYSYASKGVPIAFFFTGEHRDYHANTDSADKILFSKQARIAQLVYQVGFAVADSVRMLRRDKLGPRSDSGSSGPLR